jgi:DtxR family Mn-dependent transcriptional regulator
VELTDAGKKKALRIIRRHRLWELFLVEVLKYDWDEIDEEAERLEHSTSERLEQRIDEILGYPDRDPHGHVIPTAEGSLDDRQHPALATVHVGATVAVVRVSDESPELLQYLSKLRIAPGTTLKVIERIEFDGSLRVESGALEQFISPKLAQNIFVELLKAPGTKNEQEPWC